MKSEFININNFSGSSNLHMKLNQGIMLTNILIAFVICKTLFNRLPSALKAIYHAKCHLYITTYPCNHCIVANPKINILS